MSKYTPGMKAAKVLRDGGWLASNGQLARVAAIIDEATAASELLAVLERIEAEMPIDGDCDCYSHHREMLTNEVSGYTCTCGAVSLRKLARAAIDKADGK